jgi:hypothetical protein
VPRASTGSHAIDRTSTASTTGLTRGRLTGRGGRFGAPRKDNPHDLYGRLGLEFTADNNGMALFRTGNIPGTDYRFPRGFQSLELSGTDSRIARIATQTGTHIIIANGVQSTQTKLQIWGDAIGIAKAKEALDFWSSEVCPPGDRKGAKLFDKVGAHDWNQDFDALKIQQQTAKLEQYRLRDPPDGLARCMCLVPWNTTGTTPDSVLGHSLEALDNIRMAFQTYITLIPPGYRGATNEKYLFKLVGDDQRGVYAAARHLVAVEYQLAARRAERVSLYLVKEFATERIARNLTLLSILYPKIISFGAEELQMGMTLVLGTEPLRAADDDVWTDHFEAQDYCRNLNGMEPGAIVIGGVHATRINALYLASLLEDRLSLLTHYMGYLRMRARVGTCVFTSHPDATEYDIEDEFRELVVEKNLMDNELAAQFTLGIGNPEYEKNILDRFRAKDSPFRTRSFDRTTLPDPNCRATFGISSFNEENDYQLEVDFQFGSTKHGVRQWFSIPKGQSPMEKPEPILEVILLDLKDP